MSLDERINRLVPEVDSVFRDELQGILRTLRQAEYPGAAIAVSGRPTLLLFRKSHGLPKGREEPTGKRHRFL